MVAPAEDSRSDEGWYEPAPVLRDTGAGERGRSDGAKVGLVQEVGAVAAKQLDGPRDLVVDPLT